jgi:hypothetical protein
VQRSGASLPKRATCAGLDLLILLVLVTVLFIIVTGGGAGQLAGSTIRARGVENPIWILTALVLLRYALGDCPILGARRWPVALLIQRGIAFIVGFPSAAERRFAALARVVCAGVAPGPDPFSRSALRRLAPFRWLASRRSLASSVALPPGPDSFSRSALRRLAPFPRLARGARSRAQHLRHAGRYAGARVLVFHHGLFVRLIFVAPEHAADAFLGPTLSDSLSVFFLSPAQPVQRPGFGSLQRRGYRCASHHPYPHRCADSHRSAVMGSTRAARRAGR